MHDAVTTIPGRDETDTSETGRDVVMGCIGVVPLSIAASGQRRKLIVWRATSWDGPVLVALSFFDLGKGGGGLVSN